MRKKLKLAMTNITDFSRRRRRLSLPSKAPSLSTYALRYVDG